MFPSKQVCRNGCFWGVLLCMLPLLALSPLTPSRLLAQEEGEPETEAPQDAPPGAEQDQPIPSANILADEQSRLADKYRRLEDLIFKMADFEATSNPRRSALLKQAYKQSKDRLTQSQLNSIVQLLSDQQFKRALDGQQTISKDLQELLQLLLSEDRSDRLKSETEKIKEYIKELKRLERIQRSVRGRTEGANDPRDLAKDQGKVADRTGDLAKQLEDADAKTGQNGAGQPGDDSQQPGEEKSPEGEPKSEEGNQPPEKSAAKGEPDKPAQDQQEPGKQEQGKQGSQDTPPGQPTEGQPPEGPQEPSKSQPGGQDPPPDQPPSPGQGEPPEPGEQAPQAPPKNKPDENPAKKRVREAEQKMREAQQKLEEAKRSESVEKQTAALEKLQEAIAELEEVLRQLREEEMERVLALLEGRFRKMLEMEMKVYEGTLRIDKIPEDKRGRAVDIRASKLAFDQRKIASEADRCLTLLLEEGSSVAFPEVVEQLRDEMEEVSARLDQAKVERITQGLEEEIIGTLEELIAALQKAQQDMEKGRPAQPGEPGAGDDPPLVDTLAELKMIRSLQQRVNSRTSRYARLLDNPEDPVGQALQDDLRSAIGKLSELESRIQRVTRDIVLGKNK